MHSNKCEVPLVDANPIAHFRDISGPQDVRPSIGHGSYGLHIYQAEFTTRYLYPFQSQIRPGLPVELFPRFPALLGVVLPEIPPRLPTGILGAVTGPAVDKPAPYSVEVAPSLDCAVTALIDSGRLSGTVGVVK